MLATATLVLGACAETVIDDPTADRPASEGADGDASAPPPVITAPSGSPDDLLTAMADAMSVLGNQIIDDGRTESVTLTEIDEIWSAVRSHVESTYPELVGNFETTIEMAHTAVTRIRPADADKAYRLLLDLVSRVDAE